MADNSLQALLSTKAALDLGLVTHTDYDAVKSSFLKAQKLRAAVDAGLMNEDDFEAAKREFVASVFMQPSSSAPTASEPAPSNGIASRPVAPVPAPPAAAPIAPRPVAPPPAPAPAAPVPAPSAPPPPPVQAPPPAAPRSRPSSAASLPACPPTNPNVPSNIPAVGGAKPISGSSMSGISLTEDAVNLYYLMRARSTYRWALWQIDDSGTMVVIADVGDPASTFADFVAALPENDCRYGVFDYQYTAENGQVMNKLVFFNWAPDNAKIKAKMMHASTKDFFKSHLDGISAEFQASDLDDIQQDEVEETVRALKR